MAGKQRKKHVFSTTVTVEYRSGLPRAGEAKSCIICKQPFTETDTWQKIHSPDGFYTVSAHNHCSALAQAYRLAGNDAAGDG